jgi:hypothetical protein
MLLIPDLGKGLHAIADLAIATFSGIQIANF